MKLETKDIVQVVGGGSVLSLILTFFANAMGWIRFGKKDKAEVGKLESEIALNAATVSEKKNEENLKLADTLLQWTVNLSTRLEQAFAMLDRKQEEIDRLHGQINTMNKDFERELEKIKEEYDERVKLLEKEFEKSRREFELSRRELLKERDENREEIKRLKYQIDGTR